MGKIHKALEKSKKERQQARSHPLEPIKRQLKNRRQPINIPVKKSDKHISPAKKDSRLGAIHALLGESINKKAQEKEASGSDHKVQHEESTGAEILSVSEDKEHLKESSIELKRAKQTKPPPADYKEEKTSPPDEGKTDSASWEPADLGARKVVSLKSTQSPATALKSGNDDYDYPRDKDESLTYRINTPDQVRLHYSIVTLGKPNSFEAEQFKILRANILFPKSGKPPKTILLTSAVPGEGKTFTAMNLAVSLAQNINSHVLLVDADIRKPEIHKRFGIGDNIYGLSDFLTQNVPIPSLLVKTPLSNLTILPGGQATINPSELISSDKMKKLLDELSTRYSDRFVIIDAPPPKLAAETYALARFVEHIIPVVRAGRSNRDLVDEMMNLLGRDKIQGVVLNCYDIRDTKRFGYHKYSEYYST